MEVDATYFFIAGSKAKLSMRIDAHQHFWIFDPVRDNWITDDMQVLQNDFLPAQLAPLLQSNGFDGCVLVQSDSSEAENRFQLQNAASHDFVKGVVGWVNLQAANIQERLSYYKAFPKMKGFRHMVQGEPDDAFLLRSQFQNGIRLLGQFGFTYDLLIYPKHLKYALELVTRFPDQLFVIDHLAKPNIKSGEIEAWKKDIAQMGQFPNVYCKVSGMVTEADWQQWQHEHFKPYLDTIVAAFGTHRLLYGSDWPVCLLAGSYEQQWGIVQKYFRAFSTTEQDQVFGGNAQHFYQL